jgi:hypothetical protein
VRTLTFYNGVLYACGNFTTAGGNPANRIAKWDGNNWTEFNPGLLITSSLFALANLSNKLYIGVSFGSNNFVYYINNYNNVSECYTNSSNNNSLYYYNS